MSRPTPLEIQDALYGGALRTVLYATAAIAVVAFVAPWEAGPDGTAWTWDVWQGAEAFYLLPLVAGVLLGILGWLESVPGLAVGGAALAAGVLWSLLSPAQLAPPFAVYGAGVADRATLANVALPLLLAGLAWRRALYRTIAGRVLLAIGALGTLALFAVPMGDDGVTLFQAGVLDPFASGQLVTIAGAVPLVLVALGTLAGLTGLLPSSRPTGGSSALALAAFHLVAVAVAFGHVLPFAVGLPDAPHLSFGVFAVPLKLGALWYAALLWLGLGSGTACGALEAWIRREPIGKREAGRPERIAAAAPHPPARPLAVGQPIVLPAALPAATVADPSDAPLPPPPGLVEAPLAEEVPPLLHSPEPNEVLELASYHALPILDAQGQARPAAAAPAPSPPPSALPQAPAMPTPAPRLIPAAPPPRTTPVSAARPLPAAATARPAPTGTAPATPKHVSSPAAGPVPLPLGVLPTAPAAAAPALRRSPGRTQLGMPAVAASTPPTRPVLRTPPSPGAALAPGTAGLPRASALDASGRTGDTSLGLPVANAPSPGQARGAAPAEDPSEVSGLRFWPPAQGLPDLPRTREAAATPAFGTEILRDVAMRQTPAVIPVDAGVKRPRAATPAPVRLAEPQRSIPAGTPEPVRHRISSLQRQLARGEITTDQYQQRLDELLKPGKR